MSTVIECSICGNISESNDQTEHESSTICAMCGNILESNDQTESSQINEVVETLILPQILFQIKDNTISPNIEIMNRIRERFSKDKKLVIIVCAGMVGTGKSSWLNTVLFNFTKEKRDIFKIGNTAETETEGLWVLPKPLTLNEYPDIEFMLLDMEGMGGIRQCENKELVFLSLKKLYMIGIILASSFIILTHHRVDSYAFDILEKTFEILKQNDKICIQFPKVYLLPQDHDTDERFSQNQLLQQIGWIKVALMKGSGEVLKILL